MDLILIGVVVIAAAVLYFKRDKIVKLFNKKVRPTIDSLKDKLDD